MRARGCSHKRASVVVFKKCVERRRFQQLTKKHPRRTHDLCSHSDIYMCCNLSGDATHTFLKRCFAERTISSAKATFKLCQRNVWSVFWRASTRARAEVNVQLRNVAVVVKIVRPAAMFSNSTQNPLPLKSTGIFVCPWLQPQACEQGCVKKLC